jgi:hypothetical protein
MVEEKDSLLVSPGSPYRAPGRRLPVYQIYQTTYLGTYRTYQIAYQTYLVYLNTYRRAYRGLPQQEG